MNIESLYPFVAIAYGTFGIIFGVTLWWKTQRRIDKTKTAIETQVAAAVVDIRGQVKQELGSVVDALNRAPTASDLSSITAKVDGLVSNFTEFENNIPDFDQDALMAKLDALEQGLPDVVGQHVSMAIKGVQATEGKQIAAYVESLGIEGLTEEAKAAAVERLTIKQRAAYELMTMKVPSKTKKAHPMSTTVFEQSRGMVAQYILESDDTVRGNVQVENRQRGGSFSPGYNP